MELREPYIHQVFSSAPILARRVDRPRGPDSTSVLCTVWALAIPDSEHWSSRAPRPACPPRPGPRPRSSCCHSELATLGQRRGFRNELVESTSRPGCVQYGIVTAAPFVLALYLGPSQFARPERISIERAQTSPSRHCFACVVAAFVLDTAGRLSLPCRPPVPVPVPPPAHPRTIARAEVPCRCRQVLPSVRVFFIFLPLGTARPWPACHHGRRRYDGQRDGG